MATPLGAELHPCTHGSHKPTMGIVTAHSRKFDVCLACLDECRVFVTPWGLGSNAIGKKNDSASFLSEKLKNHVILAKNLNI